MNVRFYFLLLICMARMPFPALSQTDSLCHCLFKAYTDGEIILKDKRVVRTKLNYDAYNQILFYQDGKQEKYMYRMANVDTIRIGGRLFIPYRNRLLECCPVADGDTLLVDWKCKAKHLGVKGPMGTYTQSGGIASVDMMRLQRKGIDWDRQTYYYTFFYRNTYSYPIGGRRKKFSSSKSFLRLFPKQKQQEWKKRIRALRTDFKDPNDIVSLLEGGL